MASRLPVATKDGRSRRATADRLSRVERVIERSTFHFDVAACIRWLLCGSATVLIAIATVIVAYRNGQAPPTATGEAATTIVNAIKSGSAR